MKGQPNYRWGSSIYFFLCYALFVTLWCHQSSFTRASYGCYHRQMSTYVQIFRVIIVRISLSFIESVNIKNSFNTCEWHPWHFLYWKWRVSFSGLKDNWLFRYWFSLIVEDANHFNDFICPTSTLLTYSSKRRKAFLFYMVNLLKILVAKDSYSAVERSLTAVQFLIWDHNVCYVTLRYTNEARSEESWPKRWRSAFDRHRNWRGRGRLPEHVYVVWR